ncbi:unnamed protein product [Rotaria sp. Silwood1]|nr:unnamed protein product [Rotaria sp. Silwood1]
MIFRDDNTTCNNNNNDYQSSSINSLNFDSMQITQRQLSDSRILTKCFILFENASLSSTNLNNIDFLEYLGTRARYHHSRKLYLPQVTNNFQTSSNDTNEEFSNCIKQVLESISYHDLSSYVVSVRTGVLYFFSKRFRFNNTYTIEDIHNLIEKKISTNDKRYYYPQKNYSYQSDENLRSSFSNVKPINQTREFVEKLKEYKFYVQQQKHVYRIYLQSEDKQTHICTVDPASNYSIVEFSKDFQRTSNIDFSRDRSSSKYKKDKTYDDIFDFRIQFQYNPCTRSDQMDTINYELHQQFPSLSVNFKNENILEPLNNINNYEEFYICKELCPYVHFIRRDFGDVYQHNGDDKLFENFNIYLESSVEYSINYQQSICKRHLDTHGIVYARLNLNTMISSNSIDEDLLISKLWNMGEGLTYIAGQYTTSETQQSTNYYTSDGNTYTAQDEAIVQTILQQSTLCSMLGLRNDARDNEIEQRFNYIKQQLHAKWHCIRAGLSAREKIDAFYEQKMDNQQSTKMPKPFDNDTELNTSTMESSPQQFGLREDDGFKQEDDYRQELMKVQDEIVTLRQVLGAKLKRESELKTLLGVGFVDDLKQDWQETVHDIKSSTAYQKTAETLQAASNKIAPALQTVNTTFKTRLGSLRNSNYFKTFENTLGSTVSAVKSKMTSSKSAMHFNGNDTNDMSHGATGGSIPTSVSHDDYLNFSDNTNEKKDLTNK